MCTSEKCKKMIVGSEAGFHAIGALSVFSLALDHGTKSYSHFKKGLFFEFHQQLSAEVRIFEFGRSSQLRHPLFQGSGTLRARNFHQWERDFSPMDQWELRWVARFVENLNFSLIPTT